MSSKWRVPASVVPTDRETAASGQYDKLHGAAELALAELRKRVNCATARDRARRILERALGKDKG